MAENELSIELDGVVYLVEKNGSETKRTPFDSKLMLKILAKAIEEAVHNYIEEQ